MQKRYIIAMRTGLELMEIISGPVMMASRLVQPEKDRDPEKKGYAVLIAVERAEDLAGEPLKLE